MEDKLEIRVGDVVRLKPMVVRQIDDDGDVFFKGCRGLLDIEAIESIISRAETDAEQIARLNRELEEQKADVRAAERAYDDLFAKFEILRGLKLPEPEPKPEVPWCPPRLKGYGAWIEGPPPRWMPAGSFQPLAPQERDGKTFYAVRGDYDATEYQHCVAHCITQEW